MVDRFVVCGEALIDLIHEGRPDTRASTWSALSAGGPMNTAIALARLDQPVAMLARLGADQFADQLRAHLEVNSVSLDLAVRAPEATSLAVVSLNASGHPSYTFHFGGTANFEWRPDELPELGPGDWLHLASLATVVPPGHEVLLEWARAQARHVKGVSLDINVRPTVLPDPAEYWRRVEPWLEVVGGAAGVLKASDEDLQFLTGQDWRAAAEDWRERYGARVVVVTCGPSGAVGFGVRGPVSVPSQKVSVVDTVGAGDTFMAGFLDAFVAAPGDLEAALAQGIMASALVVQRQGANPPTRLELVAAQRGVTPAEARRTELLRQPTPTGQP